MADKPLIAIFGLGETESQLALLLAEKKYQVICIQPESIPPTVIFNSFIDVVHLDRKTIGNLNILRPDPDTLDQFDNDYRSAVNSLIKERAVPILNWNEPWKDFLANKDKVITIICSDRYLSHIINTPGLRIAIGLKKFFPFKKEFDILIGDKYDYNHSISYLPKFLNQGDCRSIPLDEKILCADHSGIWNLLKKTGDILNNGDLIGKIDNKELESEYNKHILYKVISSGTPVNENDEIARLIPETDNYLGKTLVSIKAIIYEIEKFM